MKKKNINKEESEPYIDNLIFSDDSDDERSNKIINDINNYSINDSWCVEKNENESIKLCEICNNKYAFEEYGLCKDCLINEIDKINIDKYKYCLENDILLDLNEIKFKDKFLKTKDIFNKINRNISMDEYKKLIKKKICTLCYKILDNDINIMQLDCGCCYCYECQMIVCSIPNCTRCNK